jgi:hypothetical protein
MLTPARAATSWRVARRRGPALPVRAPDKVVSESSVIAGTIVHVPRADNIDSDAIEG